MVNPRLTKKSQQSLTISDYAKDLFKTVYREQKKSEERPEDVPRIKVSDLISKMSFYYEKIRNTVDYKEDNLLQKNAIERILKRHVVIEGALKTADTYEISRHLLTELIRAGYLPNNKIPETKIDEIEKVISKYLLLRKYGLKSLSENRGADMNQKAEYTNWILSIAASDIEERLGRSDTVQTVIKGMYDILTKNIELPENSPYDKDKDIQIFIGIHRTYLKFDREMLSYILFKYYVSSWNDPDENDIRSVADNIHSLKQSIEYQLDHPLNRQMNRIIGRYTVFYRVLTDVVAEDPVGVYEGLKYEPETFKNSIKKVCNQHYLQAKIRLWRAAIRSIVYIFITKSVFAVVLEVPATKWFGEELNPISLAINITFPALLLFLIVAFTKMPSMANTAKIIQGIEEIVFEEYGRKDTYKLRRPVKRGGVMNSVFGLIYAITFFLSFGFVVWSLYQINFTWVSIIIFLFFLAFVSFFSIRIRKNTKDLLVEEPKESIFSLFADFFYTPIVMVGKWLSEKFSRVNVFVFVLDFIIEAPFKIFVEIAEEWTRYVRERKEEIS